MDKPRRIWLVIVAVLVGVTVLYVASFGPACRWLAIENEPTVYRPCIYLALDGPDIVRVPLNWWVDAWGGEVRLTILSIARMPRKTQMINRFPAPGEVMTESIEIGGDSLPEFGNSRQEQLP